MVFQLQLLWWLWLQLSLWLFLTSLTQKAWQPPQLPQSTLHKKEFSCGENDKNVCIKNCNFIAEIILVLSLDHIDKETSITEPVNRQGAAACQVDSKPPLWWSGTSHPQTTWQPQLLLPSTLQNLLLQFSHNLVRERILEK